MSRFYTDPKTSGYMCYDLRWRRMIQLPKHKCGLYLRHNEHKDLYQDIGLAIELMENAKWENDESKKRAADTDELWILQWYPRTPIGFHCVAAPTFEEVIHLAMEVEKREDNDA